jgi:hypothetical protein
MSYYILFENKIIAGYIPEILFLGNPLNRGWIPIFLNSFGRHYDAADRGLDDSYARRQSFKQEIAYCES